MPRAYKCLTCVLMLAGGVGCQQPQGVISCPPLPIQEGRYQLSEDQRSLYLTDTATGRVWRRGVQPKDGPDWESLGVPTTRP